MHDEVTDAEAEKSRTAKTNDATAEEEEIERDDFGLPIRKWKLLVDEEAEKIDEGDSKARAMSQREGSEEQKALEDSAYLKKIQGLPEKSLATQDENSEGDEDFKDAPSTPISDARIPHTPIPPPETTCREKELRAINQGSVKQDLKDIVESQTVKTTEVELGESGDTPEAAGNSKGSSSMHAESSAKALAATSAESIEDLKKVEPSLKDIIQTQSGGKPTGPEVDERPGQASLPESSTSRQRGQSNTNGVSEWSHQHMAPQPAAGKENDDEGWQDMPAFAPYDIYDDDNRLIAREVQESDDEAAAYAGLGGAGKGYTRVQLDEDAQSATSLDENTQYLFKEANGTSAADIDDEQRDALSQMQATKDLLTEGQRIAYVGMTRLALSVMLKEAEAIPSTRRTKKEVRMAAEAMKMWSQKMMVRLYTHMDISTEEQIMIEQLAEHGVEPADLTPTLMQNSRVKNPMADNGQSSRTSLASQRPNSFSSDSRSPSIAVLSPRIREESAAPPAPYVDHEGEDLPEVRTPSQLPTTKNIDIDLRWTVLCDLFLTLIADSIYDSRSRVVLERVGKYMGVEWLDICRFEKRVTDALEMQQAAEKENWNEDEHKEARRKMALNKRYLMMGLATVGGGLVIGLSAGLLAPVIGAGLAAGFTTIGVAGTSTFLASTSAAAIITSGAAASGGIIAIRAADRRTGAVKTFEYRPLHNNKRVNLIVTVSGWMTGKVDDVRLPYSTVDPIMGDIYSVLWEPEMLTSMGDTINILATEALTQGLQQVLGSTILIGLMSALQLPVVLSKLAYLIDNPWTVSLDRANAAGLILADSLIDRNLGTRPITFVGYSLGSRMIFSCLKELARKGAYGIVQNVYLFGSPIVANNDDYLRARTVVSGRFVNGYARTDWILGYLFRLTSGGISQVAGLAPIEGIPGIENVDVTEFVPGHMSYRAAMPRLLREVGWLVESDEFTEIEDPDPENHHKRQRELINEIEEARKELDKEGKKGKLGAIFGRKKKTAGERKEWETYQESKDEAKKGPQGDYGGILFDVDAIRAELASEHMEVRELKSTLPPMKLDLNSSTKVINPMTSPPSTLQKSQSFESNTMLRPSPMTSPNLSQNDFQNPHSNRFAPPSRIQPSPTPSYRSGNIYGSSMNLYSYGESDRHHEEQEIQMTFDDSPTQPNFNFNKENNLSTTGSSESYGYGHIDPSPPKAEPSDRSVMVARPELKSSSTVPITSTMSSLPSINVERNAWAEEEDEDDEFGREREMEMTFA